MPAPETSLLGEWLRHAASLTPDAPAIVEEERITSFGALCEQADALARRFVALGVKKQDRIALVMPKTTDAIICVFASLFAGAMYVPIHPKWPKDRVEATLEECNARLVIEGDANPNIIDRQSGASILWQANGADSGELPEVDAEDAAFILFTSGSTGRAKGVVLSHRAVSAFVRWSAREFHVCPGDRIACPSPLGFDLSTFDIFSMALCGATCVLVPEHIVWMPRFLAQFVRDARITCWYSVPSILAGMLQDGRLAEYAYPALRLILFAGEVFPAPQVQRLQAAIPQAELANLYGPTETNVVTWYRVPRGFGFEGKSEVPIGRACPYAAVTVDAESGELLAGGASLMTEYWKRPEETQRAFVTLEGVQYYRTGDRVSSEADGNYSFIGRLDRQVKRRGFRIELGEIEAALLRHEDILEAASVTVKDERKGIVIVAFVRSRSRAVPLAEAKAHCARTLPLYMLPDHILSLDAIPKGARGKIDYLALGRLAEGRIRGD